MLTTDQITSFSIYDRGVMRHNSNISFSSTSNIAVTHSLPKTTITQNTHGISYSTIIKFLTNEISATSAIPTKSYITL